VSGDVRYDRFRLRGVAAMQVNDEIPYSRHHVRRVQQFGFTFPRGAVLRTRAAALSTELARFTPAFNLLDWSCM
jgi:hypothetical protein